MCDEHVVGHLVHLPRRVHCAPRRVLTAAVMSQHSCAPGLVDGDPVLDAVAEACEAQLCVLDKVVDDLGVKPAVLLDLC